MGKSKKEIIIPEIFKDDLTELPYPGKNKVTPEIKNNGKRLLRKLFNQGILQMHDWPEFCNKYFPGFDPLTINGWLKESMPELNEIETMESRINLDNIYKKLINRSNEVIEERCFDKSSEELYSIKTFTEIMDKYVSFLERYGVKPKIPDVQVIEDGRANVDTMREIFEKYSK